MHTGRTGPELPLGSLSAPFRAISIFLKYQGTYYIAEAYKRTATDRAKLRPRGVLQWATMPHVEIMGVCLQPHFKYEITSALWDHFPCHPHMYHTDTARKCRTRYSLLSYYLTLTMHNISNTNRRATDMNDEPKIYPLTI